jgi:hypothetical protein
MVIRPTETNGGWVMDGHKAYNTTDIDIRIYSQKNPLLLMTLFLLATSAHAQAAAGIPSIGFTKVNPSLLCMREAPPLHWAGILLYIRISSQCDIFLLLVSSENYNERTG